MKRSALRIPHCYLMSCVVCFCIPALSQPRPINSSSPIIWHLTQIQKTTSSPSRYVFVLFNSLLDRLKKLGLSNFNYFTLLHVEPYTTRSFLCICVACVHTYMSAHVWRVFVCRYPVCSGSASPLAWPCPPVVPSEPAAQPGSGSPPL